MRTFLILAALGWAISLPWAALFGYCALIVAALAAAWFLSVSIERHSVSAIASVLGGKNSKLTAISPLASAKSGA